MHARIPPLYDRGPEFDYCKSIRRHLYGRTVTYLSYPECRTSETEIPSKMTGAITREDGDVPLATTNECTYAEPGSNVL